MVYERYISSGFTRQPTEDDPRSGRGEFVLFNPTEQPCEATMTVHFVDRPPKVVPPIQVAPESNTVVVFPRLAPEVFTNCGFWGARIAGNTPLMLNLISSVRVRGKETKFRGGTTCSRGQKLNTEWYFPDGLWLEWNKFYEGDLSKAPFPFNELEYYHFLNPNPRPAQIRMTLNYCSREAGHPRGKLAGQKQVFDFELDAERVMAWDNMDKVRYCQPYTVKVVSSEPIATTSNRYIYGLTGFAEWGQTLHVSQWAVSGPLPD